MEAVAVGTPFHRGSSPRRSMRGNTGPSAAAVSGCTCAGRPTRAPAGPDPRWGEAGSAQSLAAALLAAGSCAAGGTEKEGRAVVACQLLSFCSKEGARLALLREQCAVVGGGAPSTEMT